MSWAHDTWGQARHVGQMTYRVVCDPKKYMRDIQPRAVLRHAMMHASALDGDIVEYTGKVIKNFAAISCSFITEKLHAENSQTITQAAPLSEDPVQQTKYGFVINSSDATESTGPVYKVTPSQENIV